MATRCCSFLSCTTLLLSYAMFYVSCAPMTWCWCFQLPVYSPVLSRRPYRLGPDMARASPTPTRLADNLNAEYIGLILPERSRDWGHDLEETLSITEVLQSPTRILPPSCLPYKCCLGCAQAPSVYYPPVLTWTHGSPPSHSLLDKLHSLPFSDRPSTKRSSTSPESMEEVTSPNTSSGSLFACCFP